MGVGLRVFLISVIGSIILFANANLQKIIDSVKPNSKIKLPAGRFIGNIVIDKPLILEGSGEKTILDGNNNGTVITITSSNVKIRNLKIINSGSEHERVDAGIAIKNSMFCEVSNCKIENALFGIDLQNVHNSIIKNNYISSKNFELGLRGDGVRLWYSNDNKLTNNHLYKSRDFVIWYSHGNLIANNIGEFGRYSLHFMYAGRNIVKNNIYKHNSVGIFFMYSRDSIAINNLVMSSVGTTGIGIGLKDCSNFTLKDNTILYCATGLYLDRSPLEPGEYNHIEHNKILYNTKAIHFHSLSIDNIITKNEFKGNIENIFDDSGSERVHSIKNKFSLNYWDDYQGFDKNKDNIGDTPYENYLYADKIWINNPNIRFFYASPVISILNFLYKLAPISEPVKLVEDKKPLIVSSG